MDGCATWPHIQNHLHPRFLLSIPPKYRRLPELLGPFSWRTSKIFPTLLNNRALKVGSIAVSFFDLLFPSLFYLLIYKYNSFLCSKNGKINTIFEYIHREKCRILFDKLVNWNYYSNKIVHIDVTKLYGYLFTI